MKSPLSVLIITFATCVTVAFAGDTCPEDVDGDGFVGVTDLTEIILLWGTDDPNADINGDGIVNVEDLTAVILAWGCTEPDEPMTTLSGTVTNAWTAEPIQGAAVLVDGVELTTDASGFYTGEFAVGIYDVTFSADNFIGDEDSIVLFPDLPATLDVALDPVAAVVVTIETSGDAEPDGTVMATAIVDILDGSDLLGFSWSQLEGPPAVIGESETDTISLDLAPSSEYKARLFEVLAEPPIGPDQLPPNVPPPPGEFPGGLQDRFQVVGVNHFALENAGLVTVAVEVATTSGDYGAEEEVHTHLPWKVAPGIHTVPIDRTVLLSGKTQGSYSWTMMPPLDSDAVLVDATTQTPEFVPDIPGLYTVSVNDEAGGGMVDLFIFAGTYRGIIEGQDQDGRPVPEGTCLNCHAEGGVASDKFTPWAQTGHAEIFTQNFNSSSYWGPQCFECHTVGYDLDAANNGFDDASDYHDFLDAGLVGNPSPDNWTTMLEQYPDAARRANIQCENCHGPQNGEPGVFGASHSQVLPRVSLSSDVCATCHGEPLRHARFQQWQLSAHANYEVAMDEGESGSCSRCHTANGFLAWLPILTGEVPGDPNDSVEVTWTVDEVHPQTCVTCHDPHAAGNQSGTDNNATVRISGNTPPLIAGFTAYGVGRGAICMTCHNSRRGLRNDSNFDEHYGTSEASRAPHGSAQTDLLMGENAYLVDVGIRGNHSYLTDSCTQCHMVATPPPDDLSYNQSGTNHTFYASTDICSECHGGGFEAEYIQSGVHDNLDLLKGVIEDAMLDLFAEQTGLGNILDLDEEIQIEDAADVEAIEFTEYRGRQALIVTLEGQGAFGPYRVNDITVLDPGLVVLGALYDFADPNLVKAGWNWALIHNDGSLGIHNPTYAYQVLGASIGGLDPGAGASMNWPAWLGIDPPAPPLSSDGP